MAKENRFYAKKELAYAYGLSSRMFITMLQELGIDCKHKKILRPKQVQQCIKEFGEPDWELITK